MGQHLDQTHRAQCHGAIAMKGAFSGSCPQQWWWADPKEQGSTKAGRSIEAADKRHGRLILLVYDSGVSETQAKISLVSFERHYDSKFISLLPKEVLEVLRHLSHLSQNPLTC